MELNNFENTETLSDKEIEELVLDDEMIEDFYNLVKDMLVQLRKEWIEESENRTEALAEVMWEYRRTLNQLKQEMSK